MKIVVGAGHTIHPGWICLEQSDLDITDAAAWLNLFQPESLDAILSEHVLEHLTPEESEKAIANFYRFLKHGGYCRIAVPDGYNPDKNYISYVAPGSWINNYSFLFRFDISHKQLFNVDLLCAALVRNGFQAEPIEGYNARGEWFSIPETREGRITKRPGELMNLWQSLVSLSAYNSLIVDGIKQ